MKPLLLLLIATVPLLGPSDDPPSWHILDQPMCGSHAHDVVQHSTPSCAHTVCYFAEATLVITECKDRTMTCKMYSKAKDGTTAIDDCPEPSM